MVTPPTRKRKAGGGAGARRRQPPTLLGWREWVGLPDLGVPWIHAKLDTGARTSALHAEDIERVAVAAGQPERVRFTVRADGADGAPSRAVEADLVGERWIRSSNGQRERRPVIQTTIQVGGEARSIEVTLTARGEMGFQMLLGRQGLRKSFAVDPARSWILGIPEDPARGDSPVRPRWLKRRSRPVEHDP